MKFHCVPNENAPVQKNYRGNYSKKSLWQLFEKITVATIQKNYCGNYSKQLLRRQKQLLRQRFKNKSRQRFQKQSLAALRGLYLTGSRGGPSGQPEVALKFP
jgi:hypothetical protein